MAIEAQLPGPEGHDVGKPSLGPIVPMNHPTKHTAPSGLSPSTRAVHADDHFVGGIADVAPPLHVSTTFHYPGRPEDLVPFSQITDLESFDAHIYSRHTAPNSARLEVVLSSLLKGRAITYASGLAAYHATLVYLNPKRISIGDTYHGCHGTISILSRLTGLQKIPLDCVAEDLQPGDVVHVETPTNPSGEAVCIASYAEKAHSRGAYLIVDSTFGPPGLQDPFEWGADIVYHSGTKYLGGHSDMLCGVLAVRRDDWFWGLRRDRTYLGGVMGSLEGWLGLRSVRTLELRVQRQSYNGEMLVRWLFALLHPDDPRRGSTVLAGEDPTLSSGNSVIVRKVVASVSHASIQDVDPGSTISTGVPVTLDASESSRTEGDGKDPNRKAEPTEPVTVDGRHETDWLKKQMPNGYGPVFAVRMQTEQLAKAVPSRLRLFNHATSLGGVESLIEWRRMTDPQCHPALLRLSVGVEDWKDLRDDLLSVFADVAAELVR